MNNEATQGSAEQGEGVAGVGMMVAGYVDELAAERTLDRMKQAKKDGTFYFDDAAVIRQNPHGKVHIKETGDMSTGKGARIGAVIGGVVGLIGGPAAVVGGAAVGAAIGGGAAHRDAGFDNDSLKEIGSALLPGTSALVATTSVDFVKAVRKAAPKEDRLTTAKDLASAIREALELRKDVLLGMVITEEGVAATKVVSSPTDVAIFGIAATEAGVVAGGAVATAEGVAYEVAATDGEEVDLEAGVITDEGAVVVDVQATVEDDATGDEGSSDQPSA